MTSVAIPDTMRKAIFDETRIHAADVVGRVLHHFDDSVREDLVNIIDGCVGFAIQAADERLQVKARAHVKLTLTEFKRRLVPGMRIRLVNAHYLKPGQGPIERSVLSSNSVGVLFEGNPDFGCGKPSLMEWPRASDLIATEKGFTIRRPGGHADDHRFDLVYEWV